MTRASDALAIARGDVRDGVAAVEHFLQVLASRRVGPRVLAAAIPEVLAGCAPLRAALTVLAEAFGEELASDPEGLASVHRMLDEASRRVGELADALSAHEGASMDARQRLALEAIVRGIASDLGTVVRLVDLLGAPVTSETTTIDLGDALSMRRARPRSGSTQVLAAVDVRTAELTVGDARLVLDLLELAVAIIVRAGVKHPRIVVELGREGFPVFTIDGAPKKAKEGSGGDGMILDVVLRDALPHESEVVRAAAKHAGIAFTIGPDGQKVTIAL